MTKRGRLASLSLDQLADELAASPQNSIAHGIAEAEITRRQTLAIQQAADAQQKASAAQIESGQAVEDTAKYTRRNALYMLCSVIVALFAAVAAWWQSLIHPRISER